MDENSSIIQKVFVKSVDNIQFVYYLVYFIINLFFCFFIIYFFNSLFDRDDAQKIYCARYSSELIFI